MGFKKKNHSITELGLTLPEAYGMIKNIRIEGEHGTAEFVIQASRENALSLEPLKRVWVQFTVNRNENPYTTAYNAAKGTRMVREPGVWGGLPFEEPMPFHGWEDDVPTV